MAHKHVHFLNDYLYEKLSGYCGDPGTPVNGGRSITGYTEGHTVTYTCNTGYRLLGVSTRTCQSNRLWSGNLPTCPSKCLIYKSMQENDELDNSNIYQVVCSFSLHSLCPAIIRLLYIYVLFFICTLHYSTRPAPLHMSKNTTDNGYYCFRLYIILYWKVSLLCSCDHWLVFNIGCMRDLCTHEGT